jgi:hypothetical protein
MNMNRLRRMWIPVLLQTAVALAACDDEKEDDDDPPTDSGIDAGPDSGIKDAATDSGSDASVVMCKTPANAKCGPHTNPLGGPAVQGCCYSGPLANGATADSVCSGLYMGTCLPPAVPDKRCDDQMVVTSKLTGCCAINGRCGIDSNATGLGCPDLETAELSIKMALQTFSFPAGSKRLCTARDGGVGDGGTQALIWNGKTGMDAGL